MNVSVKLLPFFVFKVVFIGLQVPLGLLISALAILTCRGKKNSGFYKICN